MGYVSFLSILVRFVSSFSFTPRGYCKIKHTNQESKGKNETKHIPLTLTDLIIKALTLKLYYPTLANIIRKQKKVRIMASVGIC